MARRLLPLLFIVIAFVLGAGVARAQTKDADIEAAKIHFQAGKQYYDRGHYSEAIAEFKEAYRLSAAAALLYNIAQAYERSGDLGRAREYLQRYVDTGQTEPGELPALQDKLRTIDKRIADQKAAESARRNPPPPTPAVAEPALAPPMRVASEAPHPYRTWKWIAVGTGGAALIVAALFAADMNKQAKTLEDAAGKSPLVTYENDLPDAYARGQRDSALAIGFGVGGLAVGAVGVVLFVLDGRAGEEKPPQAQVVPLVGPGTAGAAAAWRF